MMAQTLINIRIDEELKKSMEEVCQELGINKTTAFTMFAKKVSREKRIPFEASADPFFSDSNIRYLKAIIDDIERGRSVLKEHDITED